MPGTSTGMIFVQTDAVVLQGRAFPLSACKEACSKPSEPPRDRPCPSKPHQRWVPEGSCLLFPPLGCFCYEDERDFALRMYSLIPYYPPVRFFQESIPSFLYEGGPVVTFVILLASLCPSHVTPKPHTLSPQSLASST